MATPIREYYFAKFETMYESQKNEKRREDSYWFEGKKCMA